MLSATRETVTSFGATHAADPFGETPSWMRSHGTPAAVRSVPVTRKDTGCPKAFVDGSRYCTLAVRNGFLSTSRLAVFALATKVPFGRTGPGPAADVGSSEGTVDGEIAE